MADYQLTDQPGMILRRADMAFIPNDPGNRDRQDYEAWLADGNTPDPVTPPISPRLTSIGYGQTTAELLGVSNGS